MFNGFERFRRPSRLTEHRPPITDRYRQVYESEYHTTTRVWKVVRIKEPYQFFKGLDNLIHDIQSKNTEYHTVEPSPFDPLVGTRRNLKDNKVYQRELKKMYKKYFGIHKGILKKFDDEEKGHLQKILLEAKGYEPPDGVHEDPNWHPGINHSTGQPYKTWIPDEHRYREVADLTEAEIGSIRREIESYTGK